MMSFIHNSKRTEEVGARMPVILPKELMNDWLKPCNDKSDKELLQELIKPFDQDEMQCWPVRQLLGKNGVGNTPLAREEFNYEELPY
jgi:putative SOS response-associated peptidase YedK